MSDVYLLKLLKVSFLSVLVLLGAGFSATAAVVDLSLVADGTGRWYEYLSDAFCQVDGGPSYPGAPGFDGSYQTSLLPAYTTLGGGSVCFPNGANFGNVGTVTVDDTGLTGTGTETASITDIEIEFNDFIADNDAIVGGYTTMITNESGTVTYENGVATSVDLTMDVEFVYDASLFGLGLLGFNGVFSIASNDFTLLVDETNNVRYVWDVTGSAAVAGNIAPAVPVFGLPGLMATVSALVAGAAFALRRRNEIA
jgi:hypothetical protein